MSSNQPLVDAHVHLYPDVVSGNAAKARYQIWEYGEDPGVHFDTASGVIDDLGDRYSSAGFDHAVVLQLFDVEAERCRVLRAFRPHLYGTDLARARNEVDEQLTDAYMAANRWVVEMASTHAILTPYVGIDPLILSPALITDHLAELAAGGAKGVKLHPISQGFPPDDPRLDVLYRLCCELDLVVLSHSGPGHRHGASARPSEFAPVARKYPDLRLVLAHLGGAAFTETAALAHDFPHLAFDLSEIIEWVGAPNAPDAATLLATIQEIGADRVMLGSDFPWYEPAVTADKVASLPGIGHLELCALLGGTALEVLRLDVATPAP